MAYALVPTPGGFSLRSEDDGETFHPVAGPATEAEQLYVTQLRMVDRARQAADAGREWVVWDVGLGAAGNSCTVLRALTRIPVQLRLISFEHTLDPIRFALQEARHLPFLAGFAPFLQELIGTGNVSFDLPGGPRVHWELRLGDFPSALADPAWTAPPPQVVLFDPFSPARNPAMWSRTVFAGIRSRVDPQGLTTLATFSRATAIRVALLLAGWQVGRGQGIAGKEETTVAATQTEFLSSPLGEEFLQRAKASDAAEPWSGREYHRARLSDESWQELQRHPQFQAGHLTRQKT